MSNDPRRVAVIAGDGIGPEVVNAAVEVIDVATARGGQRIQWEWLPWGSDYHIRYGQMMPDDALEQLRKFDAILLGAVGDPRVPDHVTLHGLLLPIRRGFDQYLCVRPVRQYPGVQSPLRGAENIDLVVVRENTEGEYADVGGTLYSGSDNELAVQSNIFTRRGCRRIMEAAFEIAMLRRKHVTSVTKSNAQAHSMVLWDEVFREVAAEHPGVETRSMLVDAVAMDLVRDPERFDVIVASNLFGDILSDLAAAIAGGLGIAPSGNINPTLSSPSMFEAVHGSAPDIAGKGIANPVATILAGAMLLEHIGLGEPAGNVRKAVERVLAAPGPRTPDLGGMASTTEMTRALISALEH